MIKRKAKSLKFIDLFAGLGGFHLALSQLGHRCVFASEIDPILAELYNNNHGIMPHGDIRKVDVKKIPSHDILCAGFPCQPFSKAGDQLGFDCPQWGDLFKYVLKCLRHHKPEFIIIENVPNLLKHKKGETWQQIQRKLERCGYDIQATLMSPHMVGVPQLRERAIIVGRRSGLDNFEWPKAKYDKDKLTVKSILQKKPKQAKKVPDHLLVYLKTWQRLLKDLPKDIELPSFPIWAMEFGATYPYELNTPLSMTAEKLQKSKGSFGSSLKLKSKKEIELLLPPYAREKAKHFPNWKIDFIRQNREFYKKHKPIIDKWLPEIKKFPPSFQKLEWNWKGGPRNIWSTIIQFRASGIRVKRPTVAPSLVALTSSQVPVITWERRYMTMKECAKLQSMGSLKRLPEEETRAFKALGNAVNVKVIGSVAKKLIN